MENTFSYQSTWKVSSPIKLSLKNSAVTMVRSKKKINRHGKYFLVPSCPATPYSKDIYSNDI